MESRAFRFSISLPAESSDDRQLRLRQNEMIGGTDGLGYMIIEAVRFFQTDTIVLGMLVIDVLWLIMDRLIFHTLESLTVVRWGMLKRQ